MSFLGFFLFKFFFFINSNLYWHDYSGGGFGVVMTLNEIIHASEANANTTSVYVEKNKNH